MIEIYTAKKYYWTFTHRFGPLFLCKDKCTPLKRQPTNRNKIWDIFQKQFDNGVYDNDK